MTVRGAGSRRMGNGMAPPSSDASERSLLSRRQPEAPSDLVQDEGYRVPPKSLSQMDSSRRQFAVLDRLKHTERQATLAGYADLPPETCHTVVVIASHPIAKFTRDS